jgi:AraC-like DNA-binding protein
MARADVFSVMDWRQIAEESAYNVALLAAKLRISRRQLERSTMKLFGKTPQAWLNEERLISAKVLLEKHRRVKFVAFQLGFKQTSHFSREFTKRYGLSPTAFLARKDRQELMSHKGNNVVHR